MPRIRGLRYSRCAISTWVRARRGVALEYVEDDRFAVADG
jgi:hypothetical protein